MQADCMTVQEPFFAVPVRLEASYFSLTFQCHAITEECHFKELQNFHGRASHSRGQRSSALHLFHGRVRHEDSAHPL